MARAVVSRERCNTIGTLTSGAPGGFNSFSGTGYKSALGPRLTSDTGPSSSSKGWSFNPRCVSGSVYAVYGTFTISGGTQNKGDASCYLYLNRLQTQGSNSMPLIESRDASNNQFIRFGIATNGNFFYNRGGQWSDQDTGVACPTCTWVEMRQAWEYVSGSEGNRTFKLRIAYRSQNRFTGVFGSWVTLFTTDATSPVMPSLPASVRIGPGGFGGAGSTVMHGRIGMPLLCSLGAISEYQDVLGGADAISEPPVSGNSFYLDTVNGNDSNDGITSSTAWASASKITTEMPGGLLHGTGWIDSAGTLIDPSVIDADVLNAMEEAGQITVNGDGIVILRVSEQTVHRMDARFVMWGKGMFLKGDSQNPGERTRITFFKPITAAQWTSYGSNGVYYTTNWEDAAKLYQNGRRLAHKTGTVVATVAAAMVAGDQWCNNSDSRLYVKPLDGIDPTTAPDGTFERTQPFAGEHAVDFLFCTDSLIANLDVSGTQSSKTSTTASYGSYCLRYGFGLTVSKNNKCSYYDKHGDGYVASVVTNGLRVIRRNNVYSKGHPTDQTCTVDYFSNASSSNNQSFFKNCSTPGAGQRLHSIEAETMGCSFYTSHDDTLGVGTTFLSKLWAVGCDTQGSNGFVPQIGTASIYLYDCIFGQNDGQIGTVAKGCVFNRASELAGTYTNCIFNFTNYANDNSNPGVIMDGGTAVMRGCVLISAVTTTGAVWFENSGTNSMTWIDSIFHLRNGTAIVHGLESSDTFSLTRCTIYVSSSSSAILANYNDGSTTANRTLAQLITLGLADANTVISTSNPTQTQLIPPAYTAGDFAAAANVRSGTTNGPYTGTLAVPGAGYVLSGQSVDATTGTLTSPSAVNVRSSTVYGVAGIGSTGTLAVPTAAQVLSGVSVDATTGTVTLPAAANVKTAITYGAGGNQYTGTITLPSATRVISGVQFGAGGNQFTGSYVEADIDKYLQGNSFGNASEYSGTLSYPAASDVRLGEQYGIAGSSLTGSCAVPAPESVMFGVPVDDTEGTALLDGASIAQFVWSYDDRTTTDGVTHNVPTIQFVNRTIIRGDTYGTLGQSFLVAASNGGSFPQDLDDYEWIATIKKDPSNTNEGTTTPIECEVEVITATGDSRAMSVELPAADSVGMAIGLHSYDVQGTKGDGTVWTVRLGQIEVLEDVTVP